MRTPMSLIGSPITPSMTSTARNMRASGGMPPDPRRLGLARSGVPRQVPDRRSALVSALVVMIVATSLTAFSVVRANVGSAPSAAAPVAAAAAPIRAAFVYEWYPESWANGTRYTPSLGTYDSSSASVLANHVAAMQWGGIQAGIASWWGPGTRTDTRFPALLSAAQGKSFSWTAYYEREGQSDPTAAQIGSDLTYLEDNYTDDPAWLKVNGKPVLFVHIGAGDGCTTLSRWAAAPHRADFYVVMQVFAGYRTCGTQPDSWHQYSPGTRIDRQGTFSTSISPGYWRPTDAAPLLPRDLGAWNTAVCDMVASGAQWQLITTFNQWFEGTAVESATQWQSASGKGTYLDTLRAPSCGGSTPSPSPSPTPTTAATPSPTAIPTATPTKVATPTATPSATPTKVATPSPTPVPTATPVGASRRHVFVITMENKAYTQVWNTSSTPYTTSLARSWATATNFFATMHPSLPNYLDMFGGSHGSITTNCSPSASCSLNLRSIADNIEAAGLTWKSYEESMSTPCQLTGSGGYVPRHNPAVYYNSLRLDPARCQAHVVNYTNLAADLTSASTTPNYAMITPNVCNGTHDCSVATGDTWLKDNVPALLASPACTVDQCLVVLTWDEDDGSQGNHILTVLAGSLAKQGVTSGTRYDHFSQLRTVELLLGLPTLTANDAAATPMTDLLR